MQKMETWVSNSREDGLVYIEEIIPHGVHDGIARMEDSPIKWEVENPYNEDDVFVSSHNVTENLIFQETFGGSFTKSIFSAGLSIGELCQTKEASVDQDEFGPKNSSSMMINSPTPESSSIDLKLGKFSEPRYSTTKYRPPREAEKKARPASQHYQTSFCQVLGCNTDLSSSRDYYKRHKVCQIHSKTALVVVNGMEQRFCQQCSRFHLLDAFDDAKRSCRKRLADHNERRRKSKITFNSTGKGTTLRPYHGSACLGTKMPPDEIPCVTLQDVICTSPKWKWRSESGEDILTDNEKKLMFPSNSFNVISDERIYVSKYEANNGNGVLPISLVSHNELPNVEPSPVVSLSTCARSLLSSQSKTSFMNRKDVPASDILFQLQDVDALYNVQEQQMNLLPCYSNNIDVHSSSNIEASRPVNPHHHQLSQESRHTTDLFRLGPSLRENSEECSWRSFKQKQDSDLFNFLQNF